MPLSEQEIERARAERALDIAPVVLSMHTARRVLAALQACTLRSTSRERAELIAILNHNMLVTERGQEGRN